MNDMVNLTNTYSFKKDRYSKARGGNSSFLDIYCSNCYHHLLIYQKDGHGALLRMYLDRFFYPEELVLKYQRCNEKKNVSNFICGNCHNLIGVPMVYVPEQRLAIKLIHGTFIKKRSMGVYPPLVLILK